MKKSELKNIIKECVKEVIFEEGLLSGIVTEVVHGIQGASVVQSSPMAQKAFANPESTSEHLRETKQQVISAITSNSYEDAKKRFSNPALFEGTRPVPETSGQGPLSNVDPSNPGVDISNIPGFGNWGSVINNIGK
jgi:hypothetical protein|tara:strand:- start:318 stop:725 length:408 start_codon:yes stop_codon:yes gene_type:complete